jgi:DNA-binding MarR family transcriptional regulator
MVRYRRVSQRISESSDLGRDLWQALEQRMRKQDERILDVMGRLEVVQTRMMTAAVSAPAPHPASKSPSTLEVRRDISESRPLAQQPMQRPAPSQSQESHEPLQSQPTLRVIEPDLPLDETQLAALNLLSESSKNTRQLTDALERSREHTARVMKELFEMGLVKRNDSTKPFVYQLTDEGRRRLSSGGSASPPSP